MDRILLGKKLREYRLKNNITKEAFAELLDISTNYLSDIEKGTKSPSVFKIAYIAKTLNVPIDYFFRDEDKCFQLFTINEFTNRIKDLSPEQLDSIVDLLEVFLKYAEADKD